MRNLSSRGLLSVEELNALFEERLRVSLPGGSFKVVRRMYNRTAGIKVFEQKLSCSMSIILQREGHIQPLNPVPVRKGSSSSLQAGRQNQAN